MNYKQKISILELKDLVADIGKVSGYFAAGIPVAAFVNTAANSLHVKSAIALVQEKIDASKGDQGKGANIYYEGAIATNPIDSEEIELKKAVFEVQEETKEYRWSKWKKTGKPLGFVKIIPELKTSLLVEDFGAGEKPLTNLISFSDLKNKKFGDKDLVQLLKEASKGDSLNFVPSTLVNYEDVSKNCITLEKSARSLGLNKYDRAILLYKFLSEATSANSLSNEPKNAELFKLLSKSTEQANQTDWKTRSRFVLGPDNTDLNAENLTTLQSYNFQECLQGDEQSKDERYFKVMKDLGFKVVSNNDYENLKNNAKKREADSKFYDRNFKNTINSLKSILTIRNPESVIETRLQPLTKILNTSDNQTQSVVSLIDNDGGIGINEALYKQDEANTGVGAYSGST